MADVRGLPVPEQLTQMLSDGRWKHPGDEALHRVMPFMSDPLTFPDSLETMIRESRLGIANGGEPLMIHRGSQFVGISELPWLDIERGFFVAFNKIPGDDVAVALDYRLDFSLPRVVASEYSDAGGYRWRVVANTFSDLVDELAL
jgi:hypothetical protein